MQKNAMENVGETKRKSIESGVKPRKKNRCIGSFQKRSIPPPTEEICAVRKGGDKKCLRMSEGGGEMRIYDCPKG
jgi:hypothetical protein